MRIGCSKNKHNNFKRLWYARNPQSIHFKLPHRPMRGFTLIELLVVISIIALLLSILMPALSKVKEQAKKIVCLSNHKQLGMSWFLYAEDNEDKIVNGATEFTYRDAPFYNPGDFHYNERPWVYWSGDPRDLTYDENVADIEDGALFPYIENLDSYRCLTGKEWQLRTYSTTDGVNSITWVPGTADAGVLVKKRNKINRPSERFVFVCEGDTMATEGWLALFLGPAWGDQPPLAHGKGTTIAFADGHSDFYKYKDPRTTDFAEGNESAFQPENEDIYYTQKGVWGRLGYNKADFTE